MPFASFRVTFAIVLVCFAATKLKLTLRRNGEAFFSESSSFQKQLAFQETQETGLSDRIYHSHPSEFVSGLASCILDPTCHILHHHVSKTGGTGLRQLFFIMFGDKDRSCCNIDLLKEFRRNPETFCNYQFSSYEICREGLFEEIPQTCQDIFPDQKFIILTFLREPVGLLLSAIHHICNKKLWNRNNRTLAACNACSFDQDPDYWMDYSKIFGDAYSTVLHARRLLQNKGDFDYYWADLSDMTKMIHHLNDTLYPHYQQQFSQFLRKTEHRNPEVANHCEFSLHSKMIKVLQRSSQELYRNFTQGIIYLGE